ncbi:uroporphyrinogen decarboxylase family protein [Clostridium sp. AWRP]|uniref:uroporphyrinogen decarboxylase family protein n=1 Tax=Clostridium sp. AWRP TaxID=2212991 RepID=UPI001FAB12E4|nr:uroporphyrinogen decarboxylase family protein [Clostridium sp. AWRP]
MDSLKDLGDVDPLVFMSRVKLHGRELPDGRYSYSKKLIDDMGTGFILASGCLIPPNAKVGNVKAMISAATDR